MTILNSESITFEKLFKTRPDYRKLIIPKPCSSTMIKIHLIIPVRNLHTFLCLLIRRRWHIKMILQYIRILQTPIHKLIRHLISDFVMTNPTHSIDANLQDPTAWIVMTDTQSHSSSPNPTDYLPSFVWIIRRKSGIIKRDSKYALSLSTPPSPQTPRKASDALKIP